MTSRGWWPGSPGASKEAVWGTKYPGILTKVAGSLDRGISVANASHTWNITENQYSNLVNYINNFETTNTQWSLSVNCTDFTTGAAQSIGINVPNVNTGPHQDPNKLGNWLNSLP